RLHRLVLETLEERHGDEHRQHLAELAYHAVAGRDFGKAVEYGRRAGDRALALLAFEEAARLYAIALEALAEDGNSDERTRCELLLSLGDAESRAGNMVTAREAFLAAAAIARRLDLSRDIARAAGGYGG